MGLFDALMPLSKTQKSYIESIEDACTKDNIKQITSLVKQKKITIAYERLPISFASLSSYPQLHKLNTDTNLDEFVNDMNQILYSHSLQKVFHSVAKKMDSILLQFTSNISGFESIRRAAFLQLFSDEPLNILLMGDKKIGLGGLINNISSLDPSGSCIGVNEISGGKDSIFIKANDAVLGLTKLEEADEKKQNKLATILANKSISTKSGKKTLTVDAKVKLLANATPSGGFFVGKGYDILVKQIPFTQQLMDEFHIIFLIRELNKNKFVDVIETQLDNSFFIEDAEIDFMREYIDYAKDLNVEFPGNYEKHITSWSEKIVNSDVVNVSKITKAQVLGIIRLAKANARMHLRTEVKEIDLKIALDLLQTSLEVTN